MDGLFVFRSQTQWNYFYFFFSFQCVCMCFFAIRNKVKLVGVNWPFVFSFSFELFFFLSLVKKLTPGKNDVIIKPLNFFTLSLSRIRMMCDCTSKIALKYSIEPSSHRLNRACANRGASCIS